MDRTKNTSKVTSEDVEMASICRAIARVLALLDQTEYTQDNWRQADVRQHDDLPDPASVEPTRKAKE